MVSAILCDYCFGNANLSGGRTNALPVASSMAKSLVPAILNDSFFRAYSNGAKSTLIDYHVPCWHNVGADQNWQAAFNTGSEKWPVSPFYGT